jgi:hypothetical protein
MSEEATAAAPIYRKIAQDNSGATTMYMITCDEGWRSSIVCCDMYEQVADWLLGIVGRRPYTSR